jgi:hypothetical protein
MSLAYLLNLNITKYHSDPDRIRFFINGKVRLTIRNLFYYKARFNFSVSLLNYLPFSINKSQTESTAALIILFSKM